MDPTSGSAVLESAAVPPLEIAAPIQESFLQGSLLDTHKDYLITRLRGLCDMRDKTFFDHEMAYIHSLSGNVTSGGAPNTQSAMRCRIRRSLNPAYGGGVHQANENTVGPYQLRYLGSAEPDRHVMRRLTMEIPISSNATKFLSDVGFQLEFECILEGVMFSRGAIKVLVYSVNTIRNRTVDGTPNAWTRINDHSHLVELSVLASPGDDMAAEELLALAEQLKPLVTVTKIDQRKLMQIGKG